MLPVNNRSKPNGRSGIGFFNRSLWGPSPLLVVLDGVPATSISKGLTRLVPMATRAIS